MDEDLNQEHADVKLSIVLPCLNEAETLGKVLEKCWHSIHTLQITGEIIVADNGSHDKSAQIATKLGARVVLVPERGYGAAIMGGLAKARGKYVVMGDADDSYELDNLASFIAKLDSGFELVMGNRFRGGIDSGAMPLLHKYLGNPVLSWIGRRLFKVNIGDFHCGLRAFNRESVQSINLKSQGMEFASEMVVKAALNNLKITEVPTRLRKDGRSRRPHLRTWRDGWRHLSFLLAASPRWLFVYPAIILILAGLIGTMLTITGEVNIASFGLGLNAFLFSLAFLINGCQLLLVSILARIFSGKYGFLPQTRNTYLFDKLFTLERGLVVGFVFITLSFGGALYLFADWTGTEFNSLSLKSSLRVSALVVLFFTVGLQAIFASFFASLLGN